MDLILWRPRDQPSYVTTDFRWLWFKQTWLQKDDPGLRKNLVEVAAICHYDACGDWWWPHIRVIPWSPWGRDSEYGTLIHWYKDHTKQQTVRISCSHGQAHTGAYPSSQSQTFFTKLTLTKINDNGNKASGRRRLRHGGGVLFNCVS